MKMPEPEITSKAFVEISRLDLDCFDPATATISDVKHLASYNWVEAPTPTILVPGSPARWSAPRGPQRVKKDSGFVYIAQNAARHPDSPLEPLFRSLDIEQPLFDISSTDVVTDRNNIRKLLSFVKPTLTKHGLEPFTIQVEMAEQTAIFCRDETTTSEVIGPGEFRGYGHEFEKAYTIPMVKDSTGHHRILSYRLGGMGLLVRHETDGYDDLTPVVKDDESTEDSLANILNSLSLSTEITATDKTSIPSKLTVKRGGRVIPRESTLEIKTRVSHKPLELSEIAPQVWASQTPKLVRAYHQRGTFSAPEVVGITTAVKNWENAHQEDIGKLVALINRILRVTRSWGGSSTIRYDIQKDKLLIKKTERKKMLPEDIYSRWAKRTLVDVARKTTENSPALASQNTDARTNTSAADQDEVTQEGMMANPASPQDKENIATSAVGNESES